MLRVGADLTRLGYAPGLPVFDGVDWYWLPSLLGALAFLVRQRPDVVTLQWWTGTVLHSYLALALAARVLGARLVVEFHETLDTGEARLVWAQAYVRLVAPWLVRLADGFVVHSEHDRAALARCYALGNRPVALIAHGPYDHHRAADNGARRVPPSSAVCRLLFFGVIRPFKGVEDLVRAFDSMPSSEIDRYHLTVVGETWEGWTLPGSLIAGSRYRDHITFVNRYVSDEETTAYYDAADAVVLPYHRSSASGPLHIAMSCGLPVVVTRVGGLPEAVADYQGAILVPPGNPAALREAMQRLPVLVGQRFTDPHSWQCTAHRYGELFARLADAPRGTPPTSFPEDGPNACVS